MFRFVGRVSTAPSDGPEAKVAHCTNPKLILIMRNIPSLIMCIIYKNTTIFTVSLQSFTGSLEEKFHSVVCIQSSQRLALSYTRQTQKKLSDAEVNTEQSDWTNNLLVEMAQPIRFLFVTSSHFLVCCCLVWEFYHKQSYTENYKSV